MKEATKKICNHSKATPDQSPVFDGLWEVTAPWKWNQHNWAVSRIAPTPNSDICKINSWAVDIVCTFKMAPLYDTISLGGSTVSFAGFFSAYTLKSSVLSSILSSPSSWSNGFSYM